LPLPFIDSSHFSGLTELPHRCCSGSAHKRFTHRAALLTHNSHFSVRYFWCLCSHTLTDEIVGVLFVTIIALTFERRKIDSGIVASLNYGQFVVPLKAWRVLKQFETTLLCKVN